MLAIKAGRNAYWEGLSFFDNPYEDDSEDYHSWQCGYVEAEDDDKKD